jgi:hypothetical protein
MIAIKRNDRSRRAEYQAPELLKSEPGKQRSETMESKEPRQIDEFKIMDEHGNDYTLVEYQNITETRSLKWRSAGSSWFELADGTPVGKIDDETFKIETSDTVLRRHTA